MSDYTKLVDYAAKDLLLHGDPAKAGKGTEIGAEFDAIATMSSTKGDKSGTLAQFAATTSLQLKGVISDETGSGALVFADTPTLIAPVLGTPTSGTLTNCTGLPATSVVNTPAGNIAAVTVQAAINELDTEKAAIAGSASQTFSVATATASAHATKLGQMTSGITRQSFTTGSGTYTTPAGCIAIRVRMVGGGGGAGGSGSSGAGVGGAGGNSTFGSLTANGGNGSGVGNNGSGGIGGSASGGDINSVGGVGQGSNGNSTYPGYVAYGASGGNSLLGGGGEGGNNAPGAGVTGRGYGGGGGGAGGTTSIANTAGGGGGGYCEKLIITPSATYSYAVGAGGATGTAGVGGAAGGAGASGFIMVEEYYG